jgi:protocatechuate 3,4-dioxygenase beta subunit
MNKERRSSRRRLLRATASLGVLGIAGGSGLLQAAAAGLVPTPKQTRGPFYPTIRPLEQDMDLTRLEGHAERATGQVIELTGRVLNRKGEPVPGAKIELWQANRHGRYDHPDDINPAPLDANFQGYATQLTDAEGRYRFRTIKPGAYPTNPVNPDNIRPPHIHFDVLGQDGHLVTQMYFPGEATNLDDVIFKRLGDGQAAALATAVPDSSDVEPGAVHLHWDIVLRQG